MKANLKYFSLAFFSCAISAVFSQDRKTPNFSFRVGAGSNISTKHFFTDDVSFNVPTTSLVHFGVSTNIIERNEKSLFLGVELQATDYYPVPTEKSNLAYFSLLVGKTRKYNINQKVYLKQTHGISFNSLAEVTSSSATLNPDYLVYTGDPFTNINLGAFTNLQVLFEKAIRKNRRVNYGLGFDLAYKGLQIYKDRSYPSYLARNFFLQYGLNINMGYNF